MLIWIAVILLCDAGFALWHERRIERVLPKINIKLFALIEALLGIILTTLHFMRSS